VPDDISVNIILFCHIWRHPYPEAQRCPSRATHLPGLAFIRPYRLNFWGWRGKSKN